MARRTDPDENFERFTKRLRKPKGHMSIPQLVVSTTEATQFEARTHELPPLFKDQGLEELHARGVVNELMRQLKSGKEATVYMGRGERGLVAVKLYSDQQMRGFRDDSVYRQGRHVGDARLQRAIDHRSRKGLQAQQHLWIEHEYHQLCVLHAAGVAVPEPLGQAGKAIAMEFIGDERGPAPRISDIGMTHDQARDAFHQSLDSLIGMARAGFVHGDYSGYNLLWWNGHTIVIDLPQMVEFASNPNAMTLLRRDVGSLCASFTRFGLALDAASIFRSVRKTVRQDGQWE